MNVPDIIGRVANSGVGRLELAELSLQCTTGQMCEAEPDDLISLMELLSIHVKKAVSLNLLESASAVYSGAPSNAGAVLEKWLKCGDGRVIIETVRDGLEAASIIGFLGSQNIERFAVNEDAVYASISLMQGNLSKHLIPALNNTGHVSIGHSEKKKRRMSPQGPVPAKELKIIYQPLLDTMTLQLILMDRLVILTGKLSLDTQQVLHLTSGALRSLEVDCFASSAAKKSSSVQMLQIASIGMITAAFRRYSTLRDTIMDEVLSMVPSLPTAKRSLRTYSINYTSSNAPSALREFNTSVVGSLLGHQNHTIQMMSALVLSLVQCCVVRPTLEISDGQSSTSFQSGLQTCQSVADSFAAHLLRRCTKSNSGASVDSFRTMLSNFTEDMLQVFLVPAYPASKLLLFSFEGLLKNHLSKATRVFGNDQKTFETTYLNSAFDVLGKICSVEARILSVSRERPLGLTTGPPMSLDSEEEEVSCHCSSKRSDVFLVQCDSCNRVFHGACIGITTKESVPEQWSCDSCLLGRILVRESSKISSDERECIDKSYVLHHSGQAMVSHRLGEAMEDAVRVSLASWVDLLQKKDMGLRRVTLGLLEYWDKPGPAGETLTEEGVVRVILALSAENLPKSVRSQIGFVVKIMEDPNNASLRKLSLKLIDQVVKGDQAVMMIPLVATKVSERLSDDSISVREAAVALVGEYIARSPQAIKRYGASLVPCLQDPGVSVRKRVIRIFEHILSNYPSYSARSKVCNIMLQRAADPKEEDGVRDLIDDLFANLWLGTGNINRKRQLSESMSDPIVSIPGVVTPTSPTPVKKRLLRKSDMAAEQMMEVVKAAGTGIYMEAMIKKLLLGEAVESDSTRKQTERKKRREMGLQHCLDLVDALFELLVVIDEEREYRPTLAKDIAAALGAIAVFAAVCPHQLVKHIDTVLPYLKADNGVKPEGEALIVSSACTVLSKLALVLDQQVIEKLSNTTLGKDLGKICYRFGGSVVDPALETFSALAHHSEGAEYFKGKLLAIAKVFYDFLIKKSSNEDLEKASAKVRSGVFRALTILGHVCQHYQCGVDWDHEVESESASVLVVDELNWDNLPIACFRIFNQFLERRGTQCKALAALKGIFLAHPHLVLLLDHRGLFTQVMGEQAGVDLQLESLTCWSSILFSEEQKIDSGEAAAHMDHDGNITVSKRVSGDQNGDATVFGSVLNKHSPRLFQLLLSGDRRVRKSTLELLGIALRQGLLNPNEVVPHLFALLGEAASEDIRALALELLMIEGEKRPDVIRQRMSAGVKQAFLFQREVYPTQNLPSSVVVATHGTSKMYTSIFEKIFEHWIVKQRKLRESVYKSLVRMFDFDTLVAADESVGPPNVPLLAFVAQVLAHLPYSNAADPLFIIHHTNQIVTLQGQQLQDQLADILRTVGLSSEDEMDTNHDEEDQLELASRKKCPSKAKEARPLVSKSFDLRGFVILCKRGKIISLLLRLKSFLMQHYGLSLARCLEFDPTIKKDGSKEKPLTRATFSQVFDTSSIQLGQADANTEIDMDSIILDYAEFRQLMRAEQSKSHSVAEPQSDTETVVL